MKVGLIGLGRMGEGMSRRMMAAGHEVWGYRRNLKKAEEAYEKGYVTGIAYGLQQLSEVIHRGTSIYGEKSGETVYKPAVFMMVIPAELVEDTLNELLQFCNEGDIIIDHGNSNFKDSRRRAERLSKLGIQYIDCGTSGGVYGLERGYCLMVGGTDTAVVVPPTMRQYPRSKPKTPPLVPQSIYWMPIFSRRSALFLLSLKLLLP